MFNLQLIMVTELYRNQTMYCWWYLSIHLFLRGNSCLELIWVKHVAEAKVFIFVTQTGMKLIVLDLFLWEPLSICPFLQGHFLYWELWKWESEVYCSGPHCPLGANRRDCQGAIIVPELFDIDLSSIEINTKTSLSICRHQNNADVVLYNIVKDT